MNVAQIRFYDLVRKDLHLTDDKAAAFVEALGDVLEFELKNEKQASATKEDIHQLSLKIDATSLSGKEDIHQLNLKIDATSLSGKEYIYQAREDIHKLEIKLEQSKVDIYKAMFWTGIVQLLAILGGVLAIVKFASS